MRLSHPTTVVLGKNIVLLGKNIVLVESFG